MIPELIDMTDEEAHAACAALSRLLRIIPAIVTEATTENAHALRVQHQPDRP